MNKCIYYKDSEHKLGLLCICIDNNTFSEYKNMTSQHISSNITYDGEPKACKGYGSKRKHATFIHMKKISSPNAQQA